MLEIWKQIEYAPRYQISNLGRVMNAETGKLRKLKVTHKGYNEVTLVTSTGSVTKRVHRLVGEAFVPKPEVMVDRLGDPRDQIDHRDMDKTNNRSDNLRWCSNTENTDYLLGNTKEERSAEAIRVAKEVADRVATRKALSAQNKKDKKDAMVYGSKEAQMLATSKPVKVNGVEFPSAGAAAKHIMKCEGDSDRKQSTVSKEIRKYLAGKRGDVYLGYVLSK